LVKRKIKLRSLAAPAAIALAGLLALPLVALAGTTDAITQTGGMTATLPILGSSLTVSVTLDGSGNLSQVNLDPVGTATATKISGHAVTFDNSANGTQVRIKARGSSLSISATAGSLDALVGSGTWGADVFGTGTKSTVAYTIGKNGTAPTVSIDSVAAAPGVTAVTPAPAGQFGHFGEHSWDAKAFQNGSGATGSVAFSANGYTKILTISVSVSEKATKARLKITLTGRDVQKLTGPLASLVGSHSWAGKACDGTAVGILYTVNADGTLTYGSATGGTAAVHSSDKGFSARFAALRLEVRVMLMQLPDGSYALAAGYHKGCIGTKVPLPTTNAPVAPGAAQQGDHSGNKSHKHGSFGGHSGNGHGGGHH
jgi:hypothetical protein